MSRKKQPLAMKHVPKGWGWERWIVNCPEYCGKLLFFNKGKRCSWHFHKIKDEVFYLQSGKMMVYYSMNDDIKEANQIVLNPLERVAIIRDVEPSSHAVNFGRGDGP